MEANFEQKLFVQLSNIHLLSDFMIQSFTSDVNMFFSKFQGFY